MKQLSTHHRALFYLILCSILWSIGGLFIKLIDWTPNSIAGVRSLIAAVALLCIERRLVISKAASFWIGVWSYALVVTTFVMATKLTTAANAILLQSTSPIYIALLGSWYLNEKTGPIDWVTMGLVFVGLLFFFPNGLSLQGAGDLWALASGFFFACFVLSMRKERNGSPISAVILGNFLAFIINLPMIHQWPGSSASWLYLIILGVVQLAMSYWLYSKAVQHVTAIETILILLLEPILNPLLVFIFLGERPGLSALIGGVIVLGSVTFRSFYISHRVRRNKKAAMVGSTGF